MGGEIIEFKKIYFVIYTLQQIVDPVMLVTPTFNNIFVVFTINYTKNFKYNLIFYLNLSTHNILSLQSFLHVSFRPFFLAHLDLLAHIYSDILCNKKIVSLN